MFDSVKHILKAAGPFRFLTVVLFILIIISSFVEALGITLIIPFTSIIFNNKIIENESEVIKLFSNTFNYYVKEENRMLIMSLIFMAVFMFKNLLLYSKDIFVESLKNSLIRYWSVNLLDRHLSARYSFIKTQKKGVMLNNIITEPINAAKFVGKTSSYLARICLTIAICMSLFFVDWEKSLIIGFLIAILFGVYLKISQYATKNIGAKRLALMQKVTKNSEQSLAGIKHLKMLNEKKYILDSMFYKFSLLKNIGIKLAIYKHLPKPVAEILIVGLFISLILYIENYSYLSVGEFLPMITFVIAALYKLSQTLSEVISQKLWINAYLPSVILIHKILKDDFVEKDNNSKNYDRLKLKNEIKFLDVSFEHDAGKKIVKQLNITIKKNSITAIVGDSGSGKSTIIDLLCSLYNSYEGKIYFDDIEQKEISAKTWRNKISYVNSEEFIIDASVKDNLILGNTEVDDNNIIEASKLSNAFDFIENMPLGFSSTLEESGSNLSSGQKQRIMITRALLRDSEIIVFDEGTSFLDKETENNIYRALIQLRKNKTIVIVSHRIDTLKIADNIYFIKNGEVLESGKYDELLYNKGSFYRHINTSGKEH